MDAPAGQGVQTGRQHRGQGLALPGLHLGHLAPVHGDRGEDLHVEGTHGQRAPRGFSHQGKRLDQELVERRSLPSAGHEAGRSALQAVIRFGLEVQLVDVRKDLLVLLQVEFHQPAAGPIDELGEFVEHAEHRAAQGRSRFRISETCFVPGLERTLAGRGSSPPERQM